MGFDLLAQNSAYGMGRMVGTIFGIVLIAALIWHFVKKR